MIKAINVANEIAKDVSKDCSSILQEYNLHYPFDSIFMMDLPVDITSTIIAAIIYSYDNNSKWTDLKKTSHDDKLAILQGLKADLSIPIYNDFINLSNSDINDAIGSFLDLQPDWRFSQIMRSRDYHSKAIRTPEPEFSESMEDDKIIKAKEGIGKLLREGLNHRKLADEYLLQIEKDYVNLNHRTKQDFGIDYTEAVTKRDIYSWRLWIRELNDKKVIQKDA